MISSGQKTSLLIPSQLPGFIRDNPEYQNFVLFLQAYYEWMEQNGGVTDGSKNLLNYADIDSTTSEFIDYFVNDFLQYFPEDALIDKTKAIKVARQLYETKGTPASYEFLFRTLYNSSFEVYNTKDAILKASAGNWYVPKSLKILYIGSEEGVEIDNDFLNIQNLRLFGETSKAIATVDNSVVSGNKVEVFISDIERLFQSGEIVRLVDNNLQDVLDEEGDQIRGKIVGQISKININPNNRGLYYNAGDPVVVYGGLSSNTGIGATAQVGSTTLGSINSINVLNGGYGYQPNPNSVINIIGGGGTGAIAVVGSVDNSAANTANLTLIPSDVISSAQNTTIGNTTFSFFGLHPSSNANTTLSNAFSFLSLTTYPISSVLVTNGGGGFTTTPSVTATSLVTTPIGSASLSSLGILGPLRIINSGVGYRANDKIQVIGGGGVGAYANVISVNSTGGIITVGYEYENSNTKQTYPLGGLGYITTPTMNVVSSNTSATGAVIGCVGILGTGAVLSAVPDARAGSISTINVINPGEDYISSPNVSLKVQDIVVSNVSIFTLPQKGDVLYQGTTYQSYVDSITFLNSDVNPANSQYVLRAYNYTSPPNPRLPLLIEGKNINLKMANTAINKNYDSTGVRYYGDGTALATSSFLNGLVIGQGQFLDSQGWPSAFNVLQSEIYNNFTYEISVEKEIAKYREILLQLLHPSGTQILGRYILNNNEQFNNYGLDASYKGEPVSHYTHHVDSSVTMSTDFNNKSTNVVQFNNLYGTFLPTFMTTGEPGVANTIIDIRSSVGVNVRSEVIFIDPIANKIKLKENTWLTFANVAYVTANSGSNVINISTLTGSYDIINNGFYKNPNYPILDIVYPGDTVLIDNNTSKIVSSIDYINNKIYLTTNLTNSSNSLLSVNRTFNNITGVTVYGAVGVTYIAELITEDGISLTTEDGNIIILG